MSLLSIVKWCQKFEDGCTDLTLPKRVETVKSRSGALQFSHVWETETAEMIADNFPTMARIQTTVLSWLRDQGVIVYRQSIERLVERSDKYLQRLEDCVEKQYAVYMSYCILAHSSIKCFLTYISQEQLSF